jgi:arylsulfatase A-like enzyme
MSGWYPHVRGHRTIAHMMKPDEPVLLRELRNVGYFVWVNERGDLVPADGRKPYKGYADTVFKPKKKLEMPQGATKRGDKNGDNYYSFYRGIIPTAEGLDDVFDIDEAWVDGAIDFIKNRPKDKPFCVYLPLQYPHPPYQIVQKYFDLIDENKLPPRIPSPNWDEAGKPSILKGIYQLQNMQNWDEPRWNLLRKVYLAMCARVDAQFGRVIKALRETGVYDDTAVFLFSDHGDYTGDYGLVEKNQNTFEDCLIKVPFIFKPPKDVPVKPGINPALVELVDFYATAADLAGVTPDHTHFGKSLLPLIRGDTDKHRDYVFCEGGRLQEEKHCNESYYKSDLASEASEYYPRLKMQASQGPEHTKATMIRNRKFKYVHRLYEKDELYDLTLDPGETYNRIDDPNYTSEVAELKAEMLRWYQETTDVVPFKEDARMSVDTILRYMKAALPPAKYWAAKIALKSGRVSLQQLAEMGRRKNN